MQKEICSYPDCEQEMPEYGYLEFGGMKVCFTHHDLLSFLKSVL